MMSDMPVQLQPNSKKQSTRFRGEQSHHLAVETETAVTMVKQESTLIELSDPFSVNQSFHTATSIDKLDFRLREYTRPKQYKMKPMYPDKRVSNSQGGKGGLPV